ncbi:MAG: hypothetical protein C5B59_14720 [Bacteroidetes bacterium]|nr:MAG: hypothetical protein C5B59_14720 [Bacteroidota bacterium]
MPYLSLQFLKQKIDALQNALFFPLSDSPLKIPTCVVRTIKLDEVGQIWFTLPCPKQLIYTFDNSFGARLDFSRKGQEFFLKIIGTAFIVIDPEEINSILYLSEETRVKALKNEIVLIKVRISHADYFEKKLHHAHKMNLKDVSTRIYKWFFHPRQFSPSVFKKSPVGRFTSTDHAISQQ